MTISTSIGLIGTAAGLGERVRSTGVVTVGRSVDGVPPDCRIEGFRGFFDTLEHPRVVLLDLAAGSEVDTAIDEAYAFLEPGDVVLDPTPSWWCDTLRRYRRMRHRALYHVDAALLGSRALVAGDARGVEVASPVLAALVGGPAGVVPAGPAGSAHFAAAVAQGVALARRQALDEARQLLEAVPGSSGAAAVLAAIASAGDVPGDGRAAWLLDDAVRLEAATPLLAQAVMQARAAALEAHEELPQAPRLGAFVLPEELG